MTDEQVLAEKVYGCWHEHDEEDSRGNTFVCIHCGKIYIEGHDDNHCTFTSPAELGPLILWAVKQEWWEDFDDIATEVWWPEGQSPRGDYLAWLFQSTEHFAKLLAAYLRKGE